MAFAEISENDLAPPGFQEISDNDLAAPSAPAAPKSFLNKTKDFLLGDTTLRNAPGRVVDTIKDAGVGIGHSLKSANDFATNLLFHPVDTGSQIAEHPGAAVRETLRGVNSNIPFANAAVEKAGGPAAASPEDAADVPAGLSSFAGVAAAPGVGKMLGGVAAKTLEHGGTAVRAGADAAQDVKSFVASKANAIDRAIGEKAVASSIKPPTPPGMLSKVVGTSIGGAVGGTLGGHTGALIGAAVGHEAKDSVSALGRKLIQSLASRHLRNLAAEAEPGLVEEVAGNYAARTAEPSLYIPRDLELNPIKSEPSGAAPITRGREPHPVPETLELNPRTPDEPRTFKGDEPRFSRPSMPPGKDEPAVDTSEERTNAGPSKLAPLRAKGRVDGRKVDVDIAGLKEWRDKAKSSFVRDEIDRQIRELEGAGSDEFGVPMTGAHYVEDLPKVRRQGAEALVKLDELRAKGITQVPPELQAHVDDVIGKITPPREPDISPRKIIKGEMLPETAARKQRGASKEKLAYRAEKFGGANSIELKPDDPEYQQKVARVAQLAHELPTPMFVKIAVKAGLSPEQAAAISEAAQRKVSR